MKTATSLIFLGSVFLTSGKFVDTENTIKFYFTVLALLLGIAVFTLKSKNLKTEIQKITSLSVFKGFFIIGVLQAGYGILQYIGKYTSNHSAFLITGSFDNPAGFITILSLVFPVGLFWCIKAKKMEQRFVFFAVGLVAFAVILTASRSGILSLVISSIIIFSTEYKLPEKLKKIKQLRLILVPVIIMISIGGAALYKWKEDSANGRLLIWKVSTQMVKEKPLFGYGYKGFQGNYMDFQARYFKENPGSKYRLLADNTKHPFNEFIKIAVNYGLAGLLLYVSLLVLVLWKILKSKHPEKNMLTGIYAAFIVLSCFSYPLQYTSVWFLSGVLILTVFAGYLPEKKTSLFVKIPVISLCFAGLLFFSFKVHYEMQWKKIAVKSLQGKTKQMLSHYEKLYSKLKSNTMFLYNYGAELNVAKDYDKSNEILTECQKRFNDYDLQMLLADNYYKKGEHEKAIQIYEHANNMIPCRFLPLYKLAKLYQERGNYNLSINIAKEILNKPVKVQSTTVSLIKREMEEIINKNLKPTKSN